MIVSSSKVYKDFTLTKDGVYVGDTSKWNEFKASTQTNWTIPNPSDPTSVIADPNKAGLIALVLGGSDGTVAYMFNNGAWVEL